MPTATLSFSELESMVAAIGDYHPKGPFPLFTKDLMEDTIGWIDEARWRYLRVLEHMFHQGGYIPDDPIYFAGVMGTRLMPKWSSKTFQIRLKLISSETRKGFRTNKHVLRDVMKAFKRSEIGRMGGETKAANRLLSVDLKGTDGRIYVQPPSPIVEEEEISPKKSRSLGAPLFEKESKKVKEGKEETLRKTHTEKTGKNLIEGNGFDPDALVAIWNEIMAGVLPKVIKLNESRKVNLRCRMRDTFAGEINQWRAYLERIKASPFLCGDNDRGWTAHFTWAVNSTNAMKVLEGNYDTTPDGPPLTLYETALAKWFGDGEPADEKPNPEDYR